MGDLLDLPAPPLEELLEGAGVVTSRADVHCGVTEHGVAKLFGKSLRERVEALVGIADPRFRDDLERAAARCGTAGFWSESWSERAGERAAPAPRDPLPRASDHSPATWWKAPEASTWTGRLVESGPSRELSGTRGPRSEKA